MLDRILVTGASGFVGSHLLDLLVGRSAECIAWYRPGGRAPEGRTGVAWEAVDLLDAAAVREALMRVRPSRVYHCAGAAHVGRSWEGTEATLAVNVLGTHHLVEGLRTANPAASVLTPSSAWV
jgi:nucleoside-diphosphate-sugar epimerase